MTCTSSKVAIPADFGIHRLGSPSHSNLKFHLREGQDIVANSIIISLNSPVIDHFTTDLSCQSVDVQDFERDAVQCFIEGCYEGKLKKLDKNTWREVNKMSKVFEVSWMEKKCAEYFEVLLNTINSNESNYEELLFIFEEAFYVQSKLKVPDLMEKVIQKFNTASEIKQIFLERFLESSSLTKTQLDLVIRITGRDVEILVRCILHLLEANKSSLGDSSRYLLQNTRLSSCLRRKPDLQHQLIQSLEAISNPTTEDFRLVLSLFDCVNQKDKQLASVPNLFNSPTLIMNFTDFQGLLDYLSTSEVITSLYMFFEGLLCWLFDRKEVKVSPGIIDRIQSVRKKRKWHSVSRDYVDNLPRDEGTVPLLRLLKKDSDLVTSDGHLCFTSNSNYDLDEFFFQEREIKFIVDRNNSTSSKPCSEAGTCGLLAKVTPSNREDGSMFNIQFILDPYDYPSDMHYCADLASKKVHFVLNCFRSSHNKWRYFPVTWCGKPEWSKDKTVWRWGANCFTNSSEKISSKFETRHFRRHWLLGKDVRIKPELFVNIDGSNDCVTGSSAD